MKAILCLCLFLLCACTPTSSNDEPIRLAVSVYNQSDPFIDSVSKYIKKYADEYAEEYGITIQVDVYDAMGSQTVQNKQMDQFIDKYGRSYGKCNND